MMKEMVYQASPEAVQTLHQIRESVHKCCQSCMNRIVRVQTMDGEVYEGMLMGMDHKHLYLSIAQGVDQRQFFPGGVFYPPASSVILPLVLYELLVISLLY